ncbi:MAG: hypothetical protein U0L17_04970 [Acutalibacteraceae bacterium]|nr:hypothetical protein [Acutalibacteraceae bacterium]
MENSINNKKKRNLIVLLSFLGVLLLICTYLTIITVPALKKTEFGQRINYCHNRGSIEFYVEGKKVAPEDIKLTRENNGEIYEETLTDDDEFAFFSGKSGLDTYKFYVDKESSERLKDIEVTFENFNDNWWYVNNFDIKIDITKKNGKITTKGECYLNGEKIIIDEEVKENDKLYYCNIKLRSL